jgi:hypothetical protein
MLRQWRRGYARGGEDAMVLLRMEGIRQRGFTDGENAAARCGGSVIRLWEMKSERERENKRTRQMGGGSAVQDRVNVARWLACRGAREARGAQLLRPVGHDPPCTTPIQTN